MRNEYDANQSLAAYRAPLAREQADIRAHMRETMGAAYGYDRIGQHAFKAGPRRVIKTSPGIIARAVRAVREWL